MRWRNILGKTNLNVNASRGQAEGRSAASQPPWTSHVSTEVFLLTYFRYFEKKRMKIGVSDQLALCVCLFDLLNA
jgi:hypothetical protein